MSETSHARNFKTPLESEIADAMIDVTPGKVGRPNKFDVRTLSAEAARAISIKFGGTKIADLIDELTRAECVTNGGKIIADNRTRLAAVTLAAAYMLGRPVERSESVSVNLDADDTTRQRDRLRKSPALRASLARMIAEVENEAVV